MKLKNVKQELVGWCKTKDLYNTSNSVKMAKERMLQIQKQLNLNPLSADLIRQEKEAIQNYIEQANREEESMRLKARAIWLQRGDQNSKNFHFMHRSRTNSNIISAIKASDGNWLENQEDIALQFANHFKDTYKYHKMSVDISFQPKRILHPNTSTWLSRPFSDEEILSAIKAINRDKAPWPDGFTAGFFQDNWTVIKSDVLKAIKNFFKH